MGCHREVLVKQLDHILGQLDRGLGHFQKHKPILKEGHIITAKAEYRKLKEVLLEVDREALETLTRMPSD